MLEQNDLQQIKEIVGKGFEDFAIFIKRRFEEQNKYIGAKFDEQINILKKF